MDKTLLVAVLGALVAGFGWVAVHILSSRREMIARHDAAARDHLEKQIEQLYGPLLGLIKHSRLAFEVAARILPKDSQGHIEFNRFSARESEIWHFFVEEYFLPVNARIRDLMGSKMHLFEAGVLPKSFNAFFQHEVQFEALHRLWRGKGIDSPGVPSLGWPMEFEGEVNTILDALRLRHQLFLRRLGVREQRHDLSNYN